MKRWWLGALAGAGALALVGGGMVAWRAWSGVAVETGPGSFYDLQATSLEGEAVPLSRYKGRVALVVNTASACGFTPQYEGLEELYQRYRDRGFVVLGFPCNEFGGQEPGSPQEIRAFCTAKFHVTFPLFAKVSVKPGPEQAEVYRFLTAGGQVPSWNFCMYLVGLDGRVLRYYPSLTPPGSSELHKALEGALGLDSKGS